MTRSTEKNMLWVCLMWIAISVASMFVSVISYTQPNGKMTTYALQDLIDGKTFSTEVLYEYTGDFRLDIDTWALTALCVLGIAAVLAATIGVIILSKQKPTTWPYVMTLVGVVGTAIPSFLIYASVWISRSDFPGEIGFGLYPVITPIAMLLCLVMVIRERKRKLAAHQATINASAWIRPAGDL